MPDPFFSLLHVFGPTAAAYCKMHSSKESQDEGLCRRLTKFQAELRSQLRTRCNEFAEIYGHEESEGVNAAEAKSANETKPLSKSAARKLKKQQSKNAGLATTDAASNSGKKYKQSNKKNNNKKNNSKKNNNKKKGKR